ncbi:hypothetical protein D9M68_510150 [compost metagenome]
MLVGRRCAGTSVTSAPSSLMVPDVGVSKPAIIRSSVDFPQPEGPRSEKNSPFSIPKLMLLTAVTTP